MKLIVGLGNPGIFYRNTRHNIGIHVVNGLAKKHKIKLKRDKDTFSKRGKGKIKGRDLILAQPLVFMNLSGKSIARLVSKFNIPLDNFLVIHDDLDLALGIIRIRDSGGSAGHKGLKSVIDSIGTQDFPRLRIGIGKAVPKNKIKNYVLSPFSREEKNRLKKSVDEAVNCCETWIREGIIRAMNQFN